MSLIAAFTEQCKPKLIFAWDYFKCLQLVGTYTGGFQKPHGECVIGVSYASFFVFFVVVCF